MLRFVAKSTVVLRTLYTKYLVRKFNYRWSVSSSWGHSVLAGKSLDLLLRAHFPDYTAGDDLVGTQTPRDSGSKPSVNMKAGALRIITVSRTNIKWQVYKTYKSGGGGDGIFPYLLQKGPDVLLYSLRHPAVKYSLR